MKKMTNKAHIEGKVYESNLEIKVSKKGVTYIGGKVDIATDDAGTNIVTVDFPYVAEAYSSGKENKNYGILYPFAIKKDEKGNIIKNSEIKTMIGGSTEEATMLKIDPSIELNEWHDSKKEFELISSKKLSGGFVHVLKTLPTDESVRNRFECDMVITSAVFIEANPEKPNSKDRVAVRGYIFNFANAIMPVEFSVLNPNGMNYFQDLDASKSNPVLTKVWGKIVNETIVKTITQESAFGEPVVTTSERTIRDWVITGTSKEVQEFGLEETVTQENIAKALEEREIYLANKLTETQTRLAERGSKGGDSTFSAGTVKQSDFNF